MNQDVLKQATKALSESGHEQQGGKYTRERLMASLHDRRRRSNTRFAVLLPMAAIFVGSTAFAAVTGRLETILVSALDVVGLVPTTAAWSAEPAPAGPRSPAAARPAAAPPAAVPAPSAAPEPAPEPEVAPSAEPPPEAPTSSNDARAAGAALAGRSSVRAADTEHDAHDVYRRAHAAHFKNHDLSQALKGYEAYLAQQPSGRFAVDARYNRALCLVRSGRQSEALPELERFAHGSYGGYRQIDAQRLLAALRQKQ
ncbi:MAG TPA: hypothetical protein VI197_00905 [Polyangiaceae bacterium]